MNITNGTFTILQTLNSQDTTGPMVVEWSHSQQCFHIDWLSVSCERNLEAFMEGRDNDWQVLFVFATHEECNAMCDRLREAREKSGNPIPCLLDKIYKD